MFLGVVGTAWETSILWPEYWGTAGKPGGEDFTLGGVGVELEFLDDRVERGGVD